MSSPKRWVVVLAVLGTPAPALTFDLPAAAHLAFEGAEPLASHAIATGPWAEGYLPARVVEGEVTRQVWQVASPGQTTLQLFGPLRDQIAAQGFRPLLDCAAEACGGFDFRNDIEVLPPPAMFVDLVDYRYLSAEKDGEALSILVSRSDEMGFVQLIRVLPVDPEARPPASSGQVPASPPAAGGDFAARLEGEGRVVLEGLDFATGSSRLAPGGDAVLGALAAYLRTNPSRRVALVGHTDAQGSLEANIALSRQRAQAVADRLVSSQGVDRGQLSAQGMGWLAPRASNLTPEGREANRRVEAVVLP
ncbi:OmpA family protein [Rubellimicrobium arenae]|uniref:OmpA family protein n=1 Tax=Rubellimicrobium arenae TaxID=2817372 RepID=UPI001FEE5379|nr:OmpA family protein [Rubellimicrobium arenae]